MSDTLAEEILRREAIAAVVLGLANEQGGYVTWGQLQAVQLPDGTSQRVVTMAGIWNPRDFLATLSIMTSKDGPYADKVMANGQIEYHYESGTDEGRNRKLRLAAELGLPLIRLTKVKDGYYIPTYPVFVVEVNQASRTVVLAVDESLRGLPAGRELSPIEKQYAERLVRQRVHQPAFRATIMLAYDRRCAVCVLKHVELLDAAHIIEDGNDWGEPVVTNGLSLCKIHHAAYDRKFLGISPDYKVHINRELLEEVDGPMLKHGLQEMQGRALHVPNHRGERPDRQRLDERFQSFLGA